MLSSHRPISANETNAREHDERGAPAAEAQHDQRAEAAMVPTQVSQTQGVVRARSPATRRTRGSRPGARRRVRVRGRALIEQPALRVVELARGAAFQISEAGHGYSPFQSEVPDAASAPTIAADLGRPAAPARGGRRANAGAAIRPLATATGRPPVPARPSPGGSPRGRRCPPRGRPRRRGSAPSVAATIGTASCTVVVTGSSGPSVSSPGLASRMIQRSVSTWVRGMSRTKFAT